MPDQRHFNQPPPSGLRERLRTYFIGVGVGLILSGVLLWSWWNNRQASLNAPDAQKAAQTDASAPASNPPVSK